MVMLVNHQEPWVLSPGPASLLTPGSSEGLECVSGLCTIRKTLGGFQRVGATCFSQSVFSSSFPPLTLID